MKVLIVGGGGREHALAWKIRQSPLVGDLLCAPGNAGIAEVAQCLAISADDVDGQVALVAEHQVDLTVIGPEAPLAAGLGDRLRAGGRMVVGPFAAAAEIETSKAFSKDLMRDAGVPTAAHAVFTDADAALAYVEEQGAPLVVKADGLAAGKGVSVCHTVEEAQTAVRQMLLDGAFGDAGARVVIEAFLEGEEASYFVLCDGQRTVPLATAKDHKAAYDGDRGPNTGGMGVVSPAPVLGPDEIAAAQREVVEPTLRALAQAGRAFNGFLFAGLMVHRGRPQTLEFNARLGDPETQAILPRLRSDLVPALVAAAMGDLSATRLAWDPRTAVTVVLASGGYPGRYQTGHPIEGLGEAAALPDVFVFHAGTRRDAGRIVTAGGRVLAVTALGATRAEAADRAYDAVERIRFPDMHYRRDIGR